MNRFFNKRTLGNALVFITSSLLALFAAELLMQYRIIALEPLTPEGDVDVHVLAKRAALERKEPFDKRPVSQVILDERSKGRKAFPNFGPTYFQTDEGSKLEINGEPVVPLSITASAENYYCNESGQWAKFVTDKFGFRNPNSVWESNPDIVAVGDSFTFGSCLNEEQSIIGRLRQSGRKVLNLGMGANGPLLELASLVEYGATKKSKSVIWNFFPNDMQDLERDYRNPIMRMYLKEGYSQNLIGRIDQLNPEIENFIESRFTRLVAREKKKVAVQKKSFYKLPNIRQAYRFIKTSLAIKNQEVMRPDFKLMTRILKRADSEAKKMGAKLYFVYIPDCVDYSYGQDTWKAELLDSVRALGLTIIDTEKAIKDQEGLGQQSYWYCPNSHFNPLGADIVAKQIATRLEQDSR